MSSRPTLTDICILNQTMLMFDCVYIVRVALFPLFYCEQNDLIEERA